MIAYVILTEYEYNTLLNVGEISGSKIDERIDNLKQSLLRDKIVSDKRYCIDCYLERPKYVYNKRKILEIDVKEEEALKVSSEVWGDLVDEVHRLGRLDHIGLVKAKELWDKTLESIDTNKHKPDICWIWSINKNMINKGDN